MPDILFKLGSKLFMKLIFLVFFLLVNINAESQFFKIENFGIRETVGMNIFHSEDEILPVFTTSVNYNKTDWTFMAGPALIQRMKITDESGLRNSVFKHFRISGFTLGAKYCLKHYSKARIYCFVDNMLLTYRSFEHFYKFSHGLSTVIDERQPLSRTIVFQPVAGTGIEIQFLRYMLFSVEFGAGITYRHMKYEDTWIDYPTQRTANIGQLKVGLGCKFK